MNQKRRLVGHRHSSFSLVALGLLWLVQAVSAGVITGSSTLTTATVGATTQLSFDAILAALIPTSGRIVMTFSAGVNLTQSSNIACQSVYAINNASTCTITSSSVLTMNNANTSENFVMFNVVNFQLPSYVSTFSVMLQTFTSAGTLIDQSASTAFTFTTKAGALTVNLSPVSNVVGELTDIQMSFFSSSLVSQSGSILVQLPKWNAGTQNLNTISYFQVESLQLTQNGQYVIPCTSTADSQLSCLLTINQPSQVSAISTTFDQLVISGFKNGFTQLIVQTSSSVFRNPPSTKIVSTFSSQVRTSIGQVVTLAPVVSIKVTQPAILSLQNANLVCASNQLDSQNTYSFTFNMSLPGPVGLKIKITIPSQMSIYSRENPSQLVLNSVAASVPLYEIPYLTVSNAQTQTVTLSNLVPNSNYYVDQGAYVKFDLISIVNPSSVQPSDSFQITFYEYDDPIMTVANGLFVTAQPGAISNIQIVPQGYRVRDQVAYKISFITQNRLFQDSQVVVKIPSQLQVDASKISVSGITTMNPQNAITSTFNSTTRQLTISGGFSQDFATSQQVEFLINSGITNGESSKPVTGFQIQTLTGAGAVIDQGSQTQALVYTPNEINSVITQACSDKQTSSQTEDVCTYKLTFMIGSSFPILSGSVIQIDLPQDLKLYSALDTIANSSTIGVADLSSEFSVAANQTTIIVQNAFVLSSAPNGVTYVQDSFAVEIASIQSPRTTAPTLSFKVRILTSDGYLQYTKVQGIYSNVYEARPFQTTVISRTNLINGDDSGVYNFTLQFSSTIYKNEYIQITPPKEISIVPGGANQCTGLRLLQSQLACTIIQGSLFILIIPLDPTKNYFDPGETVQFQVSSIKNPLSLEPTTSFNIYITTQTSQPYYVNQMVQGLSIINVNEGLLSNVRVTPDSNQLGLVTNYAIYFTTDNEIPAGGQVKITFPSQYYNFTAPLTCFAIKNIATQLDCQLVNSTQLLITKGYSFITLVAGSEVGIKLQSIQNPSQSVPNSVVNDQFIIQTFTGANYAIDRSRDLDFQIGCTYPCLDCESTLTTCTSCQMLNPTTPLYLYQNTCNEFCPVGSAPNLKTLECSPCNQPCAQCSKGPAICDSCIQSFGFPYVTPVGSCVKACEDGYFADQTTMSCQKCSGNCKSCTSAINCVTCDQNFFFIEGQCLEKCPINSIKFDSVEVQECLACKAPCSTCQNKVDECTSCSPTTYLYGTTCVSQCPQFYLPDSKNLCYKASQFRLPFITQSMTVIIVGIILISKAKYPETKGFTAFIALESVSMVFFWIYMLVFLIMDKHTASASIVSVALLGNYTVNYLWYEFYTDRLKKQDKIYQEYRTKFPKTDRFIKFVAILTSFHFFRLIYSQFFNAAALKAEFEFRAKYYRRMNRYSLFQITFTMIPTMVASIYNIFYTWYGRQVFWIDIENLAWCSAMIILHLIVLFRAEKEYIRKILSIHDAAKVRSTFDDEGDNGPNQHPTEANIDGRKQALRVAKKIQEEGIGESRLGIKGLTAEQRVVAIKAVFNKLLNGDDQEKASKDDRFKFKHGHQQSSVPLNYKTHHPQTKKMIRDYEEVAGDTLGATQTMNAADVTETNFDETQQVPLNQVLRQANVKESAKQLISSDFLTTEEEDMYNFQSAPLNAQSALQGNKGLEERHKKLQNELKERLANNSSPSQNLKQKVHDAQNKSRKGKAEKSPSPERNVLKETIASGFALELSEDSDDQIEQFDSQKWGKGTSKVVAEHFNTVQMKSQALHSQYSQMSRQNWAGNQADKSSQISRKRLTAQDFEQKIEEIKHQQLEKRLAKERAFEFVESINELDHSLNVKREENILLNKMIKELEQQIASEVERLNKVTQEKQAEIEFAENAFYTSNEDGMGVSPNNYVSQNRMPRPGHKERTPPREIPFGQTTSYEQLVLEEQILRESAKQSSEKKKHMRGPSGFSRNNVSDMNRSHGISLHSGRADNLESNKKEQRSASQKSISAAEIKAITNISYTAQNAPAGLAKTDASFYRNNEDEFGIQNLTHGGPQSTQTKVKKRGDSPGKSTPKQKGRASNQRSSSGSVPRKRGSSINKRAYMVPIPESTDQDANAPGTTSGDAKKEFRVDNVVGNGQMLSHRSVRHAAKSANSGSAHFGKISVDGRNKKQKQMSDSGLKQRDPRFGGREGNLLVADVLASNRNGYRELAHRQVNQDQSSLELYTSEDDFGQPVSKLRAKRSVRPKEEKKKGQRQNQKQQRHLNHSPIYVDDADMEYYTSTDNQGQTVQKLRRKGASPFDRLRDQIENKRTGMDTQVRDGNQRLRQNAQINDFNFRPQQQNHNDSLNQSTIQGSVMNNTGQDFSVRSSRENRTIGDKNRARSNNLVAQNVLNPAIHNATEVRGRAKVWAHDSQQSTFRANGSGLADRGQQASTLQEAGLMQTIQKPINLKSGSSSKRKKKRSAPARDLNEVYFNHTNFERAVIATNGRAPYNNKEVEMMTRQPKREGIDQNQFSFKNNWVSALNNKSMSKTQQPSGSPPEGRRGRNRDLNDSASMTATTVFQGLNKSQRIEETPLETPANPQQLTTQQQFFGGSPILLLGVGSHMKTGVDQASENNNLISLGQTPVRQQQLQFSATDHTEGERDQTQSAGEHLNWTQTPTGPKK